MKNPESPLWQILFYAALAALIIILLIKKRKQTKDSIDIDYKNKPKQEDE